MSQEPLFWYRPRSDGGYEGPLHNGQIEDVRKASGAWVPLFAGAAPVSAEPTDDEIIDIAVEPLGIDCDRMPYGIVVFARALLSRYSSAPATTQPDVTQQTLDDVMAGIPARDAEIEALRKEIEALKAAQVQPSDKESISYPFLPDGLIVATRHDKLSGTVYRAEHRDAEDRLVIGGGWRPTRQAATAEAWAIKCEIMTAQQPVSGADGTIPRHVAATLANAIYETAQKIGIANGDHSNLSVGQCLHLLDCMAGQLSGNPGQVDQFRDAAQMIEPSGNSGELPANITDALDLMDAILAPERGLLSVPYTSATVTAAREDMALIRAALAQQDADRKE